jgi:hypothetical protein
MSNVLAILSSNPNSDALANKGDPPETENVVATYLALTNAVQEILQVIHHCSTFFCDIGERLDYLG